MPESWCNCVSVATLLKITAAGQSYQYAYRQDLCLKCKVIGWQTDLHF
jgi:hypothetical protein